MEKKPLKENYLRFFKKFTHLDGQGKKVLKEEEDPALKRTMMRYFLKYLIHDGSEYKVGSRAKLMADPNVKKILQAAMDSSNYTDFIDNDIYFDQFEYLIEDLFGMERTDAFFDDLLASGALIELPRSPDQYSGYGEMDAPTSI